MPLYVLQLIVDALNEQERPVKQSKIAVLGLSDKENAGDYCESSSAVLIEELSKRRGKVHLVDPYIEQGILREFTIPK